jgi:hypothetical protein
MKKTLTLVIGLALAGSALTLSAQSGRGHGGPGPHRYGAQGFPPPIAAMFDTDTNAVLSATEVAQAGSQLLKLDKNNDGQISAEERCPGGLGQGGQGCPMGGQGRRAGANGGQCVVLALFDTDKDGTLSSAEINAAPTVLKALDKNGDGQISPDEIRPAGGRGQGCPWAQKQAQ